MIPIKQEFLHDPENGSIGDCQRAALASILELPISKVPHFGINDDGKESTANEFNTDCYEFLRGKGYTLLPMNFENSTHARQYFEELTAFGGFDCYHLIYGPSPRFKDVWHTVVGLNGTIIHDPHPDNAGLAGPDSAWVYAFLAKVGAPS